MICTGIAPDVLRDPHAIERPGDLAGGRREPAGFVEAVSDCLHVPERRVGAEIAGSGSPLQEEGNRGFMPPVQSLFQRRPFPLPVDRRPQVKERRDGSQVVNSGGRDQRTGQLGAVVGQEPDQVFQGVNRRHGQDKALEERGMATPRTCRRQVGLGGQQCGQPVNVSGGQGRLRRVKTRVHVH